MRVLLLHPEDDPEIGPWVHRAWDRVVDLGFAGQEARDRWSKKFGCEIETLPAFQLEDFAIVRQALVSGPGQIVDEYGLDWWELISIRFYEQNMLLLRLEKLIPSFGSKDELSITGRGVHSQMLNLLLGRDVERAIMCWTDESRIHRLAKAVRNLKLNQLLQVAGDKYDAGYRFRRFFAAPPSGCNRQVVLLPVAHVNAAKTAVAYAAIVPEQRFLLVTTRQSGRTKERPDNVLAADLSSYAPATSNDKQCEDLLECWHGNQSAIDSNREISVLKRLGYFSSFGSMLRDGLAVRDAWLGVFEREPIEAVFCTDDTNPYTRMPLLLAKRRGLRTVSCHHGALDGTYFVKRSHADTVLAKGRMEEDYLVNTCGVPAEKIKTGAPALVKRKTNDDSMEKKSIVFFSEPYELDGGRGPEFYRSVLPPLADLALRLGRELLIKLHPMEKTRERRSFANACLSALQLKIVRIVEGPLSEELLNRTLFALTIQSSVAVDCTIRGIPVFLCAWLNYSPFQYVEQFARFGAGMQLHSRDEIANIPKCLGHFQALSPRDLCNVISGSYLREILLAKAQLAAAV